MKYKELVKLIKDISLALPDVNSFYTGDVYEINADQSVKYASVVLTNQEHNFDNNNDKFNYNFVLFFIDRLIDDESNRIDVQTAGISALKNIVTALEDYGIIIDSFRFTLFKERFNDICSGAYANLTIQIDDIDCNEYLGIITPERLKAIAINQNGEYNGLFNKVIVDVPAPYYRSRHLEATENHKLYVASDEGLDGYESVNVNVPEPELKEWSAIYRANGSYTLNPADANADGFSYISVRVDVPEPQLMSLNVVENGHYDANTYGVRGFESVTVDVPQTSGSTKWIMPDTITFQQSRISAFDGNGIDTRNLTTMNSMFYRCTNMTEIDLSTWDTSNVKYMRSTFNTCGSLANANLNFNTSAVKAMTHTFLNCVALQTLDLSSWDVSNVTEFTNMFEGSGIKTLNISNWKFQDTEDVTNMFKGCDSLTDIITNENTVLPDVASLDFGLNPGITITSNLTAASLVNLFNALPISTHNGVFLIGATNIQKLSDAEKSIATNKGWSLN